MEALRLADAATSAVDKELTATRTRCLSSIPADISDIPNSVLNIENKTRSNPLPWKGQFSPQLVQALLERYSRLGDKICDPFMGSGTVLAEAGKLNLAAIGVDINPAAFHLAQVYRFINSSQTIREQVVNDLTRALEREFTAPNSIDSTHESALLSEEISERIARIHSSIHDIPHAALLEALTILLDLWKPRSSAQRLFSIWETLSKQVLSLPYSNKRIVVLNRDARDLPLANSSIDVVVTSPPYINVHNYHQQYRRSAEALGWHLLRVAPSEIGSNRKHRSNRFLTVVQYSIDIANAIQEMSRVCSGDGRIILVMGRVSTVRGTPFFNGELITRLAQFCVGLRLKMRQERSFRNRYGEQITEDILHFTAKPCLSLSLLSNPVAVAIDLLIEAKSEAPDGSLNDLNDAIKNANTVQPSPIYSANTARYYSTHGTEHD